MSRVAVLGAGAGGLAAAVELTQAGHEVALWNRSSETLTRVVSDSAVRFSGVLGDGRVTLPLVTTHLERALDGADVAVICLPALAHAQLFADLAGVGASAPLVLNPGQTGGALHARKVFASRGAPQPPTAELSTLTYVARVSPDGLVSVTSRAKVVRAGCLPGHEDALEWATRLFPGALPVDDVVASSLSNVNIVLHPPAAVLAAGWMEATGGGFLFYVDAMTPGVVRVLELLDAERLSVAKAYGHDLPSLAREMAEVGTADGAAAAAGDTLAAIRDGAANATIKAPGSFDHRYYREDLAFGLKPFLVFADLAGVAAPVATSLLTLGLAAAGLSGADGLDAARLGVSRMTMDDLVSLVGR